MKDEARSILKDEENDFLLDNSYGEETMEELTAAVMLMARIQLAIGNAETVPSYDAKAVSEVNASSKVHEQVSHVKCKTIIQTSDDDQIDYNIIFDDSYVENNGGTSKHDSNAHDEYHEIQMLKSFREQEFEYLEDIVDLLILWIVDSGCSKHMTGNLQLLRNFVEKLMGTVLFGNDHFAAITGYGDYVQEGDDLLTGSSDSNLYTISISEMVASSLVCLMSRATSTKSWLWHRRLSHLNFGTINQLTSKDLVDGLPKFKYNKDHLCSACEQGKIKKASLPPKLVPSTESKLELLHMDLCGQMRVASINGKKYILVIVDDYSRDIWVYFLRIKDEAPYMIIDFINQVQRNLKAQILTIRTDNGTEFKNEKLRAFYAKLGIVHKTSIARTPHQNGVVERRNRTLVEAARTMLIFSKTLEILWAEAIATACFT
ncbi:retrovirus-related pol polyprotein from transposon TNT 1-94 [Tanacetum coccineum]